MIDWSKAPYWANYVAMDACGTWYFYENEPVLDDNGNWDYSIGEWAYVHSHINSELSLKERPHD